MSVKKNKQLNNKIRLFIVFIYIYIYEYWFNDFDLKHLCAYKLKKKKKEKLNLIILFFNSIRKLIRVACPQVLNICITRPKNRTLAFTSKRMDTEQCVHLNL